MIISPKVGKPYSIIFMVFNLLSFNIQKSIIFDHIDTVSLKYLAIAGMAIVTGVIYTIMYVYYTNLIELDTMLNSTNMEEYGCKIYTENNMRYIIDLDKDVNQVYMNRDYLFGNNYYFEIQRYIANIQRRLSDLKRFDIFYIFLYNHVSVVIMSICYFNIWNLCFRDDITEGNVLLVIILIILGIAFLYFLVSSICLKMIRKIIKKRKLQFFVD